ncbi:MAG: DegT/DnrJ/EryC1/StrS family aminotransferase [Spirochaetaceae bacterium]|jgi:dTDP-4-amino-4,6-dideoxygalactose transaminase|nr:DegT/DnrJ/EryC1/StrS family aminotransferase [Spirochaetaceae bacterium]
MKIDVYSPTIRRKEMDAVLTALVEDKIGPGDQARLLIAGAREYLQYDYSLALRSPAIALSLALGSLGLADGQGVMISALSPRYYAQVIESLRLVPVYCDVLPATCMMGPETIEAALAGKPPGLEVRCIVAHHVLGFVPDMPGIIALGLPVIEDCSRSYGGLLGEARAGSFGVLTILGLEERDMLTAGGGALLYAVNRRAAAVLRNLDPLPEFCLPDMNAALAVVQFREAAKNLQKRKEIARAYTQAALQTRHKRFGETEESEYNHYAFPLILETGAKDVKTYAKRKEIIVESAFEDTAVGSGRIPPAQCPESYSLSLRTVLFPLYPRLGSSEIEKVVKLIASLP